ncbi:hypothetical protein TrLO_g6233 [Triparma laevis f. longispina]|uniref:Uncharacterized protein n=1 Tax=Triparma laevis f. longispina TaxID=1714387 RepID=A0A9W7FRI7_9STRA|nr:hypothetical protein TrLO_g6233 [Triparma laevis f. longispina]
MSSAPWRRKPSPRSKLQLIDYILLMCLFTSSLCLLHSFQAFSSAASSSIIDPSSAKVTHPNNNNNNANPPSPTIKLKPFTHFSTSPSSTWPSESVPTDVHLLSSPPITVPTFPPPSLSQPTRLNTDGITRSTIYISISSYRDPLCSVTLTNILGNAKFPERIRITVIQQNAPTDTFSCLDHPPCSNNPVDPVCRYKDQVEIYDLPAELATGPVFARSIGSRLYNGETYAMQIDAHLEFVLHWDINIITQLTLTNNKKAVLTTYLTDVPGSISPSTGLSLRNTIPVMCNSGFERTHLGTYLRHGSQPEGKPPIKGESILSPYFAAGFFFSYGTFIKDVPYDIYLPMVFQGEEISLGLRGYTFGYDFYTPSESVCFHYYGKRPMLRGRGGEVKKFWENGNKHEGSGKESMKRLVNIIKMGEGEDYYRKDESVYGLGNVRRVEDFFDIFGIDVKGKKAKKDLCKFVTTGRMHREFSKYIDAENGNGVDYEKLKGYVIKELK